jgi:hypothetical protein
MFENRRVYLLTGVAYMGAMLFGSSTPSSRWNDLKSTNVVVQVSTPESWAQS